MSKDEYRCPNCNKLLLKLSIKGEVKIEIKCQRCGNLVNLIIKQ
jgi:phage FluMu protein Com